MNLGAVCSVDSLVVGSILDPQLLRRQALAGEQLTRTP